MRREDRDQQSIIIGWKALAAEFGYSVVHTKRLFDWAGLRPKKLGRGRTCRVFMCKDELLFIIVKRGLRASSARFRALRASN